ncbi:hypothetical protein PMNALOAF_0398 [Methylobacterium adhaesivum]|uniref:YfdX family protein n=1 Tax=Methylobacterium adhaesivum TaxID=333297 RepID=A0ABT8BDY3_9HYPH|nr:YfdX family protein [Methylobacterium adhaesivum]MDN3590098.1 YfdX family protein [Methylobacterium adhaesivum]GJD29166.1 hypothetical protein PMNALOAF_0398 [Methylobacterium adhaesivum]
MSKARTLALVLAATTMIGGVALANEQAKTVSTPEITTAQKAADRDVGKLSKDGAQAFRDLHSARIAIFDAAPAQAKEEIAKAQEALTKAKTDEAVFVKAEADLKGSTVKPAHPAAAETADKAKPGTQPVAWLPIDGQLTLGEDFVATPAKTAAVTDANKSLEKGDRKSAVETLKLAGVDVNFTLAVVPLAQTTADVDQAATLIGQGKYYEANAVLKKAEDGVRFTMVDTVALPKKATANTSAAKTVSDAAGTAQPQKSVN